MNLYPQPSQQRLKIPTLKLPIQIRDILLRHCDALLANAQQSVACNALHDLPQRLCRWLLMSQDRTDSDEVRLTQQYLAIMLGVQRTTVTAVARALHRIAGRPPRVLILDDALPDAGLGSGITNVSQQVAGALGLAVLGTVATTRTKSLVAEHHAVVGALVSGYHLAFAIGATSVLAAVITALAVLRTRPAREAEQTDSEPVYIGPEPELHRHAA